MKKLILTSLYLFFALTTFCQTKAPNSNLNTDFEKSQNGNMVGWDNFGATNYTIAIDSSVVNSGKNAASIEFMDGNPDFKALSFMIPENYSGEKITLSGYIKTENVTDGYAGLWMRIDPGIAFDNMGQRGIQGTTDWTKYEITLGMNPDKTKQIFVGGLLVGKGKMWLDDLHISIDGKNIEELTPLAEKVYPADSDQEFDNGSLIEETAVDNTQLENLKDLGLIWGFLKYYHPAVARGEYNWDYELFRVLPKIQHAASKQTRDEILVTWINNLSQFSKGEERRGLSDGVKFEPDLEWIQTSGFSVELTGVLNEVKDSARPGSHYYIDLQPGVGNPEFKNERPYSPMKYPDAGFRLLSLYRYWNIIQYYFPYKNLIEEDWKQVLGEFLPKFLEAEDETAYTLAVLELIGRVHDTHANVWGDNPVLRNYFGIKNAPFKLTFIENQPVVTGLDSKFGEEAGLEIGDIITAINEIPVEEIVNQQLKYAPASNYPTQLRDIARKLVRTNDDSIHIAYTRQGQRVNKAIATLNSNQINISDVFSAPDTSFRMVNADIAYINNGSLKRNQLPKIWEETENTKGIIIDLRNYPSDFPIYDLSTYLMPELTPFFKSSVGSVDQPGLFTIGQAINVGKKNPDYYKGKVVILINEISQSSAEFHAMAYRVHPNATVIGSTTAGADGNVSQFFLPGAISTMISGIGIYYPDGKETQRIGIVPDIELQPTIQGVIEGRDELMEKAIEIINDVKLW